MLLRILAVGTRMPGWVEKAYGEYVKRLPVEIRVELVELPLGQRGKNADIGRAVKKEGEAMLKCIDRDEGVVALDVGGQAWSTEKLAHRLREWQLSGRNYSLLIGGPDGLAAPCLQRAEQCWSLSNLTLPHPLVRVLLIEQLYRAWSINAGLPYHR
jgi:23S rRNA (pseudouridine1915-N3)-methyltransferase